MTLRFVFQLLFCCILLTNIFCIDIEILTSGDLNNAQSSGEKNNNDLMEVMDMLHDIKHNTVKLQNFINVLTPKELESSDVKVDELNNELERNLGGKTAPVLPESKASSPYKMNNTCNDKACYMYESALSCKAFGFRLDKICARYLLGYMLDCPAFPAPNEVYNAPYACVPQLKAFAPLVQGLKNNGIAIDDDGPFGVYLTQGLTSEGCRRNCHQTYLNLTLDYYDSCLSEVSSSNSQLLYPLIYQLHNFNYFQQQSCVENPAILEASTTSETPGNGNCFNLLYNLAQATNVDGFSIPVLSPTCDYTQNELQSYCVAFSSMGCCFANQAAIIGHTQLNATDLEFFPACLHKYLKYNCGVSTPNPNNFCSQGSQTNLTVLTGSFNLGTALGGTDVFGTAAYAFSVPNMYDFSKAAPAVEFGVYPPPIRTSVTVLQSIIGGTLMSPDNNGMYWKPVTDLTGIVLDPQGSVYGINVQILDYTYYNGQTGAELVTDYASGDITADYNEAIISGGTITFEFQAVFNNLSPDQIATMERRLTCTDPNSPLLDQPYYANCLTTLLTSPAALQNPATINKQTGKLNPGFSTPPGFSFSSISNASAQVTYPLQQTAAYYPAPVANGTIFNVLSDQILTSKNGASSLRVNNYEIIILIVLISSFSLIICY